MKTNAVAVALAALLVSSCIAQAEEDHGRHARTPIQHVVVLLVDDAAQPKRLSPGTALWSWAQNFAMNDNYSGTTFGATVFRGSSRTSDFLDALQAHNLPAVSFIRAPAYEDGHAGSANPTREQNWLVSIVNRIMESPFWAEAVIFIAYDTSRSGSPGTRLPLLAISPWANRNYVDHTLINQASIVRFIEDNWRPDTIDTLDLPNGQASFDGNAGTLTHLFNFDAPRSLDLILLKCNGTLVRRHQSTPSTCP